MKYVLIVDDNPNKLEDLAKSAGRLFLGAEVETCKCQDDFLYAIRYDHWEEIRKAPEECLLIIDMQMPYRVGEQIDIEGGLDALNWLRQVDVRCPAIIASSEKIDEGRAKELYANYKGFVHYSAWSSPTSAMKAVLAEYLSTDE